MPKKLLPIIGIVILAIVAIGSAILFYQLRTRRISPVTPERPAATAEGIIWNEAVTCEGGNVSLSTIPDWQSILVVAEVNPSSWTWGNQTSITVQGHIAWQFPGDNEPYHEYPTRTYTKPANCPGGATPTPTSTPTLLVSPTPTSTPRASATPTPVVTSTPTTTKTPTPTPTPTSSPPIGGLPTPTPTPTPTNPPGSSPNPTPTPVITLSTSTPTPSLPVAGTSLPTIMAIGGGIVLLIMAVVLAI